MKRTAATLLLSAALARGIPAQDAGASAEPFPASTPIAEGVSPDAVDALDALVRSLVDDEEIVGAEVLLVKNGHSILHEAYGFRDLEARTPMMTNSVFCVRSMTKPLIGAAVMMLADEGKLKLGDEVGTYVPSFAQGELAEITIDELLEHTGGLPLSLIMSANLKKLDEAGGISAVAALAAGHELESAPGTEFHYSDQGADTLTAVVEAVSGMPAADFVRSRVLEPLGMRDSRCVLAEDDPLRARALPAYVGSRGAWIRFWSPDKPPLFPFFLGSQGLYSTVEDYARFLELYTGRGRVGGERLLKARSVRKTLEQGTDATIGGTSFPGLESRYGRLMELWVRPGEDGGEDEVVVFGHTGSDGTAAYAFPDQHALAFYFTQSRNNTTHLRFEEALARVFLGAPFDPNAVAPPFDDYLGYYSKGGDSGYRAIVRDGDDLAYDVTGRAVVALTYAGDDRWKVRQEPGTVLEFHRDEDGRVVGYSVGDRTDERFSPAADLPSADEVAALVAAKHGLAKLDGAGAVRLTGTLAMDRLGRSGTVTLTLAWPDRFRFDTTVGDDFERVAYDGEVVRYESSRQELARLEGAKAESARLGTALARYGDWGRWYGHAEVVQRLTEDAPAGDDAPREPHEVYAVRMGDVSAPARTLFVSADGLVVAEASVNEMEGVGRIGQRVHFEDFRDVAGALLPFRTSIEMANPMIGEIVVRIEKAEVGVEVADGAFRLEE